MHHIPPALAPRTPTPGGMRPSDPRLRRQLRPGARAAGGRPGARRGLERAGHRAGLGGGRPGRGRRSGTSEHAWPGSSPWSACSRAGSRRLGGRPAAPPAAAAVVGTHLRRPRAPPRSRRRDRPGPHGAGRRSLVTRGVSAAEPYLTRYLPGAGARLRAAAADRGRDRHAGPAQRRHRAGHPAAGAGLRRPGRAGHAGPGRASSGARWRRSPATSSTWCGVCRRWSRTGARGRSRPDRRVTDRYRVATLRTLRLAFASSAVLELVATLSVALVAVTVGVRLAAGSLDLHTALVVLLLAPEAYWPLRRVGAEFHAAAEGVATFEQVRGPADAAPTPDGRPGAPPAGAGDPGGRDLTVSVPRTRHAPRSAAVDARIPGPRRHRA